MAFYTNSLNFPNLTSKASPIGADLALIADSAASNLPKQSTLSSIFTGSANIPSNTQNTNYNVVAGDRGKVIFSNQSTVNATGFTYTLLAPGTAGAGWYAYFVNANLSSFATNTLTPASGKINVNTSFTLLPGNSCYVYCDGSNYYTISNQSIAVTYTNSYIYAALPGQLSSTLSTTLTQTQGVLLNSNVVCVPFIVTNNVAMISATINASVGLAASTVTVGIYADSGFGQQPAAAAALGAVSISTATSGVKTGTFGTPIQLYANRIYWAAIQCSSAVTLSLVNVLMNINSFPNASGAQTIGATTFLPTLANSYSAGTLPTWSGTANSAQSYVPLIMFLGQ